MGKMGKLTEHKDSVEQLRLPLVAFYTKKGSVIKENTFQTVSNNHHLRNHSVTKVITKMLMSHSIL